MHCQITSRCERLPCNFVNNSQDMLSLSLQSLSLHALPDFAPTKPRPWTCWLSLGRYAMQLHKPSVPAVGGVLFIPPGKDYACCDALLCVSCGRQVD